jgi:transposase
LMTEKSDLRSRLVVGQRRDGRREFDEDAVHELVTLCLKPGVSVARTAMDHDVNPNQLRRWVTRYQQRQVPHVPADPGPSEPMVIDDVPIDVVREAARSPSNVSVTPAFVPVVTAPPLQMSAPARTSVSSSMALAIHVRMPNGIEFDLGKASIEELTAIIQMLGRLPCSGSTKG